MATVMWELPATKKGTSNGAKNRGAATLRYVFAFISLIADAMREHGKPIIPLSVPEIIDLLLSKDEGSDPNSYLFERVDQFIMGLGR